MGDSGAGDNAGRTSGFGFRLDASVATLAGGFVMTIILILIGVLSFNLGPSFLLRLNDFRSFCRARFGLSLVPSLTLDLFRMKQSHYVSWLALELVQ